MNAVATLLLLAAPDFGWRLQLPAEHSAFAAIRVQATLLLAGKTPVAAPKLDIALELEPEGGKAIRKPLPKESMASPGPSPVTEGSYAWYVALDLRRAFGRLEPGKYTFRLIDTHFKCEPVRFEVVATTLDDARKSGGGPGAVRLEVREGKGTLVNGSKAPIRLLAYGENTPLSCLTGAEQWTGRKWYGGIGGYCGTGLQEVVIPAGESRAIELPPTDDGIVRYVLDVRTGEESLRVVSEPVLVDTLG